MPGVHIHKFSEFDWFKQQEESKLTVPGSYWLCHKNSIYKFVFMYHHMMRHFKEFTYGKDLMKVIRRIIKSKPCQGQQFSTKHILVTYSILLILRKLKTTKYYLYASLISLDHSSWTRQDKMFAILKFMKHTEVTAASRAIILTVLVKDEIYEPRTLKRDKIKHLESESKTERRNSNGYELKVNTTDTNKHISNLNVNNDPSNLALLSLNNENTRDKLDIVKCNDRDTSNVLTSEFVNIENKDVNKNSNCSITFKKEGKEKNKFHNNMEQPSSLNLIEFEELMQQEETKLQLNDNEITQGSSKINSNDEGITDSANLPYQYFIEKEIENAKKRIIKHPSSNDKKSITIYEESSVDSTIKSENKYVKKIVEENNVNDKYCTKHEVPEMLQSNEEQRTKDLSDSKKWLLSYDKTIKDHKLKRIEESGKKINDSTVKSSNITDLIMKGRMFMIQQDQDSVSVVEQITKSDIDEVLENSEKFETDEGEKCLLNSSLLKLENLVTMIEMPKETIKSNYKNKDAINNIVSLDSKLIKKDSANNQHVETDINVTNPSTFMFDLQDIPTSSKSCLEYKVHESTVDNLENGENNISSKIQFWDNDFMNMFDETFNSSPRIDIKDYSIVESVLYDSEDHINSNDSKAVENISLGSTSSVPKIISDRIITIDQIPLGLQKIVKEKLSKRNASINEESNSHDTLLNDTILMSPNESTNLEIKPFETDFFNVEERLMPLSNNSETGTDDACSNIPVMEETEMPRGKRKRSYNHSNDNTKKQSSEMASDETIPSPKRKGYSSMNKKGKHKREKEDCKQYMKMSTGVVKVKNSNVPNNKLQDITEEFYQDLMQHNECSNNSDNKLLKRTKRSLCLETDIKSNDARIEMLKFIEDITRGVKVVVKRMNIKNISSIIGDSSSLAYINQ